MGHSVAAFSALSSMLGRRKQRKGPQDDSDVGKKPVLLTSRSVPI